MSERSQWEESVISSDEAMEMAPVLDDLMRSPGWAMYNGLLKGARVSAREQAFQDSKDRFEYYQGLLAGLSLAATLPQLVVEQASGAMRSAQRVDRPKRRLPPEGDSDTVI